MAQRTLRSITRALRAATNPAKSFSGMVSRLAARLMQSKGSPRLSRKGMVFVAASSSQTPLVGRLIPDNDTPEASCALHVDNTTLNIRPVTSSAVRKPPSRETCNDDVAMLSDTTSHFRALFRNLHTSPINFQLVDDFLIQPPSIERLLDIAEIANKYDFQSFERWAVDSIYASARDLKSPLRTTASATTYVRSLDMAILHNHLKLCGIIVNTLMSRVLWGDLPSDPVLLVAAGKHGMRRLQGIIRYRQLTDAIAPTTDSRRRSRKYLSRALADSGMNKDQIKTFKSAHHSLTNLWERIRTTPPTLPMPKSNDCTCHSRCIETWRQNWFESGSATETRCFGIADVLGRLRCMTDLSKRALILDLSESISLQCTLNALEAAETVMEDVLDGLGLHFDGP